MKPYKQFTILEWLSHLEKRHHHEIQLGLERIRQVGNALNLLQPDAVVITVAGTNGKGSTVASLESIYKEAGYCVAAYTSPHLISFNERIKINQRPISDHALTEVFFLIEKTRGDISLTFFETATLAALWYFKQNAVDLIILEVGLGGRLDATNVIDADLAIVSGIDLDHQEFLGNTREAIAYEKAGILRQSRPCILAEFDPPASLIDCAHQLSCNIYQLGKDYRFEIEEGNLKLVFNEEIITCSELPHNLHPHSLTAAMLASLLMRKHLPLTHFDLIKGIEQVTLPGRLQLIPRSDEIKANIFVDVAHNAQSANYLSFYLKNKLLRSQFNGKVHAVFSALKDKAIQEMIAPFIDIVDFWYPALLKSPRAASQEQLDSVLTNYGIIEPCFENPLLAFRAAYEEVAAGDLILIYGSFYLAGAILPYIIPKEG